MSSMDDPLVWGILPVGYLFNPDNLRWGLGSYDLCFTNKYEGLIACTVHTDMTQRIVHFLHSRSDSADPPIDALAVWRPLSAYDNASDSATVPRAFSARERPSPEADHFTQKPRPHRSVQRRPPYILNEWAGHISSTFGISHPAPCLGTHLP
jgi:hypothetical protein